MALSGHYRTIGALVRRSVARAAPPPETEWKGLAEDPSQGPVHLSGYLSDPGRSDVVPGDLGPGDPGGARDLLVLVHGLGGSADSGYMVPAARTAHAMGFAVLRLNLRGADGSGEDLYHAGLTADLHAALGSQALRRFERVFVLGFSLGGHVTLCYATDPGDPRLVAAAAICSPLDLEATTAMIDSRSRWPYRWYLLPRLLRTAARVAARGRVPALDASSETIRKIRQFDDLFVAPRFGFHDAEDYYKRMSIGPRLDCLRVPCLLVAGARDPMVPAASLETYLPGARGQRLEVRWVDRGGHIAFPRQLDLGESGPLGFVGQTLGWLSRQGEESAGSVRPEAKMPSIGIG